MPFILGVSFRMGNNWQFLKYFFWNGEYEEEFPDVLGQTKYLHFKICRTLVPLFCEFKMCIENVKKKIYILLVRKTENGPWI